MAMEHEQFDVIVVGGGVNGTGIAMDAAGRGLKVLLCEMNDLASATSSSSSKLIHAAFVILSTTNSDWSGRHWLNASLCFATRHTSCGQCAFGYLTALTCARHG